jgi:hypothetical protein
VNTPGHQRLILDDEYLGLGHGVGVEGFGFEVCCSREIVIPTTAGPHGHGEPP